MPHQIALIHKDADSSYGVSIPDLSGVITAGDTIDDTMQHATEVLRLGPLMMAWRALYPIYAALGYALYELAFQRSVSATRSHWHTRRLLVLREADALISAYTSQIAPFGPELTLTPYPPARFALFPPRLPG